MSKQNYFVTATVKHNNKKIYISTDDLKAAFAVEQELLKYKTLEILNIRHGRYKPRRKTKYIEIKQIDDLEIL